MGLLCGAPIYRLKGSGTIADRTGERVFRQWPFWKLQAGRVSSIRRSQRVCVGVEVVVTCQTNNRAESEEAQTLIVNVHGALTLWRMSLQIGQLVKLANVGTKEEIGCRVIDLSTVDQPGMTGIGVEFVEPAPHFWHLAFPPLDWSPRNSEAKGFRPGLSNGGKRVA